MRVLLVEDEPLVAMIAEEALASLGFETRCARNGVEALAAMTDFRPTLAVVDIGLPDIRGDELCRRLHIQDAGLSIIVASGYDEAELAARFQNDDKIAILPKPYTEGDLARVARSLGFAVIEP